MELHIKGKFVIEYLPVPAINSIAKLNIYEKLRMVKTSRIYTKII